MNTTQQVAAKVRAITLFLLIHGGKCFENMDASNLFKYVAFHLLHGCLFVGRDARSNIGLVVVLRPENAADLIRREQAGEPQFVWKTPAVDGDAFFLGGVVGRRKFSCEVLKQVSGVWPESPRKRLFTYRKGRLVELTWPTITRFTHGLT